MRRAAWLLENLWWRAVDCMVGHFLVARKKFWEWESARKRDREDES